MTSEVTLKAGLIGCGSIAVAGHLPGYEKAPGVEVVAVCDTRIERAREVAARYGVHRVYDSHVSMLAENDLDIVSVTTPPCAHAEGSIAALIAGAHVICEKPMTVNPEESERMIAAAETAGRLLTIGQDFRHWEGSRMLKQRIERGDLGHIFYARVVCCETTLPGRDILLRKELAGGGILFCTAVHPIDLAYWLMGSPEAAIASALSYRRAHRMTKPPMKWDRPASDVDVDDFTAGLVRFQNGAAMMVETYWLSDRPQQAPFVELKGDRGTAVFERAASSLEIWAENSDGDVVDVSPDGLPTFQDAELIEAEIADFVEIVRSGGQPLVTTREALNVQRILSGLQESGALGREISLG